MLTSFCRTRTNSRNVLRSGLVTVAETRLCGSTVQVALCGSMIKAPTAPFDACLMGSAGIRATEPNSTGVCTMLLVLGSIHATPAYHWYPTLLPGLAVCGGFRPTLNPSLFKTFNDSISGCSPTTREGASWLELKLFTIMGRVL